MEINFNKKEQQMKCEPIYKINEDKKHNKKEIIKPKLKQNKTDIFEKQENK